MDIQILLRGITLIICIINLIFQQKDKRPAYLIASVGWGIALLERLGL